jgi:3-methylcrotonyl-CoA carboxylase alpha subunit
MIAKVIAHAGARETALERLAEALERTVVAGPRTNVALLRALCRAPGFRAGEFDTGFIERNVAALGAVPQGVDLGAAAAAAVRLIAREQERLAGNSGAGADRAWSPWGLADGFTLLGPRSVPLPITVDGERVSARVAHGAGGVHVDIGGVAPAADVRLVEAGAAIYALRGGRQSVVRMDRGEVDVEHLDGDGIVRAPMHGKLLALFVDKGEAVEKGHRLALIEAMKMEHSLLAPLSGVVAEIAAAVGSQVAEGAKLIVIESGAAPPGNAVSS